MTENSNMLKEIVNEIICSVRSHRTRFFLSGMAVLWGMFILVILLGASNGLMKGMVKSYFLDIDQIIYVNGGTYNDRKVVLTDEDVDAISSLKSLGVKHAFPMARFTSPVQYGSNSISTLIRACVPGHLLSEYEKIVIGRDLNRRDIEEKSRVCVLNDNLSNILFGSETSLGQYVVVNGLPYQVIGICKYFPDKSSSPAMYIPLSTYRAIYNPERLIDRINVMCPRLSTREANEKVSAGIHDILCANKSIDPADRRAIYIDNTYETRLSVNRVLETLSLFVWLVGLATLAGGTVGVGNVILVGVKERMHEFGILRSCGASGGYISALVLLESSFITVVFGSIGMLAGIWLMDFLSKALGSSITMFSDPSVDFLPIVCCSLILVVSGLIAGYVPAKKASSIRIIEALRETI